MAAKGKYDFDFGGRKILVVEDNLLSFNLMAAVLKQVKAEIVHAKNGREAIELCRQESDFSLVLMDMQMPEVDGLQATREIKQINPELPVVATTANAYDDKAIECQEAGCDAFLTKPLQFRQLFELMASYLDR